MSIHMSRSFNLPQLQLTANPCTEKLGSLIIAVSKHLAIFMGMVIICNGLHRLLRPYSQPRMTSSIIVGLLMGNISFLRNFYEEFNKTFGFIIDFGMMCYMFVLGIEMDPYVFFRKPTREAQVAYAGILSTFILACSTTPLLHYFSGQHILEFTLSFSTLLSTTASPVLTRLITHMKIGKSDIGKLVIAAGMHSDLICSLVLSIGYIVIPLPTYCNGTEEKQKRVRKAIIMGCALFAQTVFTAIVSPIFMNWVNNENPEGKPLKGSHIVLSIAFMALICASSTPYGYDPILSAFMAGICLPREGRVSKWIIGKINYMLTNIFFPIFYLWMGYEADFQKFEPGHLHTWARLSLLILVIMIGKVVGTVICGMALGFHWPESVAIGLLLTTKGHFHIYLAIQVMNCGASTSTSIVMVIAIFFTVIHTPTVVANIIRRARKLAPTRHTGLQLLDPSAELRILLCLHGPPNILASLNLMEISRMMANSGTLLYVTDMIELTDEIEATLERQEGLDSVLVNDKEVVAMRDQVSSSFKTYLDQDAEGIKLKRALALSTFNNMASDVCNLAGELMIALIILPFHKSQREDGTFDGGNPGFRYVNRKLLKRAPCSVGILVDRGFGSIEKISRSEVSLKVAVIFIGGKDDREALAYAGRVARHPGVKITVIRLLVDTSSTSTSKIAGYRVNLSEQEEELARDDECFAKFYERHVVGGRISYMEKHLVNSAETFTTLRSFEGQYSLLIVGRGSGVNSILTFGMNDWQQCPELGPIGDVLSGPDFAVSLSVLIIQQHRLRGELDGLDDDFSIL